MSNNAYLRVLRAVRTALDRHIEQAEREPRKRAAIRLLAEMRAEEPFASSVESMYLAAERGELPGLLLDFLDVGDARRLSIAMEGARQARLATWRAELVAVEALSGASVAEWTEWLATGRAGR